MYNLLIVDDNVDFVKCLINALGKSNEKFRIVNVANNGIEALNILEEGYIDVAILDIDLPIFSGIDVTQKLQELNLCPMPMIIAVSGKDIYNNILNTVPLINRYISKGIGFEEVVRHINLMLNEFENEKELEEKERLIIHELSYLGFNLKHNGTIYLYETIKIILKCHNLNWTSNLEKNIYPIISHREKKSVSTIKSNILKAINYMYYECDALKMMHYFSFKDDSKPTPKVIISTIINKL